MIKTFDSYLEKLKSRVFKRSYPTMEGGDARMFDEENADGADVAVEENGAVEAGNPGYISATQDEKGNKVEYNPDGSVVGEKSKAKK